MTPEVDPVKRVRNWIEYTNQDPPPFNIGAVPEVMILKHLKNPKAVEHYPVMISMGSDSS